MKLCSTVMALLHANIKTYMAKITPAILHIFVLNKTKFPVPTTNKTRPCRNYYTELTRIFSTIVCLFKYFIKDQWMKIITVLTRSRLCMLRVCHVTWKTRLDGYTKRSCAPSHPTTPRTYVAVWEHYSSALRYNVSVHPKTGLFK